MKQRNISLFGAWLLSFICFGLSIQAQEQLELPSFYFEIFDLPDNGSGGHTQAIAQDSFGFMWFGKQSGLYRWDGYEFKAYLNNPYDSTTVASNYIEYIYVAKDSSLWLGTLGYGLDHFNYKTETFTHYRHDPDDPSSLSNNMVFEIIEDQDGYIWVCTNDGVNRLDVSTGKFKPFKHDPNDPSSLSYPSCGTSFLDSEGTLWFGCGFPFRDTEKGGMNRYRPETEDFARYLHDPSDQASLVSNVVNDIFEDSNGNFWVSTSGDGLHLMDRASGKFQRLQNKDGNPELLSAPFKEILNESHVRFVFEDQDKKLWIGAWLGGLKYYDPESRESQTFYHDETDPKSLPENYSWTMFQSRDGTLWGLTAGMRGRVFKIKRATFQNYPTPSNIDYVFSFCEASDKTVWIGTSFGLLSFDPVTKARTLFKAKPLLSPVIIPKPETPVSLPIIQYSSQIASRRIVEDEQGWLWMYTGYPHVLEGLYRINPKSGELRVYIHSPNVSNSIGPGMITDILRDNEDRIWIATSGGHLNLYNDTEDGFSRYNYTRNGGQVTGEDYHTILSMAKDGNLWIGSSDGTSKQPIFIKKFSPSIMSFLSLEINSPFKVATTNLEKLSSIQEDSKGAVWICAATKIKEIKPVSFEGSEINAGECDSHAFEGIYVDSRDKVWILGGQLFSFDPETQELSSHNQNGTGQPLFFSHRAIMEGSNGTIYLGGSKGFQTFNPNDVGGDSYSKITKTIITKFQIADQAYHNQNKELYPNEVLTTSEIKLTYDQNAFNFEFATLAFQNPLTNKHQFKLEGYDDDWRDAGLDRKATYVKVPPGKYTFKVRGATNMSKWSPERAVNIRVFPPWWATWWAYTFYSLLGVGILYFLYWTQLSRQLQKAETQRLKELDNVKTQLYTNITHEFRTPLTVILGMARQVIKEPATYLDDGMKMIVRNGENLLSLVNQMLDLSKLESGKLKLNIEHGDIIAYLNYLIESFHSFAESKAIQIHFLSEAEAIFMDYDPEKFQQIIANLISNAVKFTPEGGHIYFSVNSEKAKYEQGRPTLVMKVRDTGSGIPENELPFIFDRFYQVDSSTKRSGEGTGIGLALTKELIKLMEGSIDVKSKVGHGTTFEIILPIYHEAKEKPATEIPEKINAENYQLQKDRADNGVENIVQNGKSSDAKKPLLLIAEDNKDVVQYLAFCLAEDYRLAVAKDGREGIDIALEITPDIIITDVMMPNVDGFELTTTLKNDERTSHIPIIMLTAKADVESKLEGLGKGVDAYLAKPFHKEELLIRVKKLLELRQALHDYYLSAFELNGKVEPSQKGPVPLHSENEFVTKVKKVVEAHMDDFEFNMDKFCKEIGLSHSQLHRKLTALTGLSATKFIRYVRLNKARELLHDPDMTITAVAFDTGFNDPSYFGRVFKKEFGITPKEWQDQVKV